MNYKIGLLYGDGIGPEITKATEQMLKAAVKKHGISMDFPVYPMGFEAIKEYSNPIPQITLDGLKTCHGWVFAPHDSASYPKEYAQRANPSGAVRHHFDLYSNVRPARSYPGVKSMVGEADVVVFRENSEGALPDRNMYKGWGEFMPSPDMVILNSVFTRKAAERIAHEAFKLAMKRKKHVSIVHKANVIQMSYNLFRSVCYEVGKQYPEVRVDDYHIDAMAAHMVRHMQDFDCIVTTNLFGDILSDLACELTGSLGLGPAINTNDTQCMAQASHGSAPDIAGKNIANPIGLMISSVMMFDWLATKYNDPALSDAAKDMENAIITVMKAGVLTPDMGGNSTTSSFADEVVKELEK
jgi:3-isopropylmalate dehydrogenase